MKIIVIPGDGIGPETMAACEEVLSAVSQKFQLNLDLQQASAGHESLKALGATVTPELLERVKNSDGLMLGPMATYDFKDESKGEINPSMFFRKKLDLYANIRPSKTYPGIAKRTASDFDLIVLRENTEGFYADRNVESGGSEMMITPDVVISLRRITRLCCERIAKSAFELAKNRKKHVTIVHKANVLKMGDGMFIDICRETAKSYPDIFVDDLIVDAMMAHAVRSPEKFDVIVTTNMFGDILSDLTAELSGSLGLAGTLNAGDHFAMGQAAHGSAPDIAGQNIANPLSQITSAAMLLEWHGHRKGLPQFLAAAKAMEQTAVHLMQTGQVTADVGGQLKTDSTAKAFVKHLMGA